MKEVASERKQTKRTEKITEYLHRNDRNPQKTEQITQTDRFTKASPSIAEEDEDFYLQSNLLLY